ncbi:Proline--tRNA ligase [Geodia barretti]|uniref:proline--tRNA ligase n=1 Tax=Geodia barretti TaxID=519541 RepID=A0AA35SYD6_GEOBA|nr:Proline--tRNA ligase [Geodia barretti]
MFGKTQRNDPAEAELASHRLMLRAGMIYQVSAGVYSYMPLALRTLRKIEQIIREEIDAAGGQEVMMSALQPLEFWEQSGRSEAMGNELFRLHDRRDRPLVLAPTHEELLTYMVKANVNSYRDLPLIIYQIQTKFRDEPRPRGGLIRVREFDMKDAYSFDVDQDGLDVSYDAMAQAYRNIFSRCGLETIEVEADSGAIGGKDSSEFILIADAGEDTIVLCPSGDYAANAEKAVFAKPQQDAEPLLPIEEAHTPGIKTIDELSKYLKEPARKTLKAVFYMAMGELVFVVIRGDLEVNEVKLSNVLGGAPGLRLASPEEVQEHGLTAGSASPIGLNGIKVVADDSVDMGSNFLAGANKPDYHLRNTNHHRDFEADIVDDIALAQRGDSCENWARATAMFWIAHYPDENGEPHLILMGCYGIGVGRLLGATIEQNHDENGMVLPATIAPYDVSLVALNMQNETVAESAQALYDELRGAGLEVLFDDRNESAGVKFNDADLIGLPIRLVVSLRNIRDSVVEVKRRSSSEAETVATTDVATEVKAMLAG